MKREAEKLKAEKSGYAAMESWNQSWKGHHLPMWAKKGIRENAIKRGIWVPAGRAGMTTVESLLPRDLFDHWGSVDRGSVRSLITQPYGNHDEMASRFADEMGWELKASKPGPWNTGTYLYEFTPCVGGGEKRRSEVMNGA